MNNSMQNSDESPFSFNELFFSKTDTRGWILAGNSVFQRVSGHTWEDLLRKPHNVIRHPDMPRGVFFLLWEYLKQNKPVGAFVKNRSQNGAYYWVYALALPVNGGYLSVRMKPSGPLLETIVAEYQALRKIERDRKIQPEEARALLLGRLKELGFPSYESFTAHAMVDQFERRRSELDAILSRDLVLSGELKGSCEKVIARTKQILESYRATKFVPLNLEVQAARLGTEGREIGVVAHQYQKMADEVTAAISEFEALSSTVEKCVEESQFLLIASKLLDSISQFIETDKLESVPEAGSPDLEIKALSSDYRALAAQSANRIRAAMARFMATCSSLQTLGAGLELVRLTGKIESARHPGARDAESLLDELKGFQNMLAKELVTVMETSSSMTASSVELLNQITQQQ